MSFALDYYLFIFIAACGVIQLGGAYSLLSGIQFFSGRWSSLIVGLGAVVASFVWFFASKSRNVPDTAGGLDGNRQATLFVLAVLSALVFTFLLSSVLRRTLGKDSPSQGPGLDALRGATYLSALRSSLRGLRGR